jgi:hypothetical protein
MLLAPATAIANFDQSDVTGTWSSYTRFDGQGSNTAGYDHGTTVVDGTGNVTGGSATDDNGVVTPHTGGSITVSPTGSVDGSITNANGTDSFTEHHLDLSASILVGVDTNLDGTVGFESAVKPSGVFSSADLDDRWRWIVHWDLPTSFNSPGYDALQIVVDAGGIVRSVAGVSPFGPDFMVVDTTQFTIDATGAVSIPTLPDAHLQMTPNKQVILGVMKDAAGYVAGGALIRDDGSGFTASDLEGIWHYYLFWDRTSVASTANYAQGLLELDANGDLLSGNYLIGGTTNFDLVDGGFGINTGGTVTGQVELDQGSLLTFGEIHLNADGNFGAGTYRIATNQVFAFFVVPEPTGAAVWVVSLITLMALGRRRNARAHRTACRDGSPPRARSAQHVQ